MERSVIKLNISNLMLDSFRLGFITDSLKHQFVKCVQFICTTRRSAFKLFVRRTGSSWGGGGGWLRYS